MFFFLSVSSLVGIYLEVVCEDCEIDLHIFHQTTLPQLSLFYHSVVIFTFCILYIRILLQLLILHVYMDFR